MSIIRPKDGDYIARGLFLLIGWTILGWVPFAIAGALLAGAGGATFATIGCLLFSPFLYGAYLRLNPRLYPQYTSKCECGHSKDIHRADRLECNHGLITSRAYDFRVGQYMTTTLTHGGCICLGFKRSRWWRTNSQDPHDWSV